MLSRPLLLSLLLLAYLPAWAHSPLWMAYEQDPRSAYEVDALSIRRDGGLVRFRYRERFMDLPVHSIEAVADCSQKMRSDVGRNGDYQLRRVFPDTRMARQLDKVCALVDTPQTVASPEDQWAPIQLDTSLSSAQRRNTAPQSPQRQLTSPTEAEPDPLADLSPDDLKLMWQAALARDDGFEIDFVLYRFKTLDEAIACRSSLRTCELEPLAEVHDKTRSMALPDWLRMLLRSPLGQRFSEPTLDPRTNDWVMTELRGRRAQPFDPLTDQRAWLRQHARDALPQVDRLRADPDLRAQRVLSQIFSVEDIDYALEKALLRPDQLDIPSSRGFTVMTLAVTRRQTDLVDALLKRGASPNACGDHLNPIVAALLMGDWSLVEHLRARGAQLKPCEGDPSLLMQAVNSSQFDMVDRLLREGLNPLEPYELVRGSSVLRWSLPKFAREIPADLDKVYRIMADKRAATPPNWDVWLELDGRRLDLTDGQTLYIGPGALVLHSRRHSRGSLCLNTSPMSELHEWTSVSTVRRRLAQGDVRPWRNDWGLLLPTTQLALREGLRLMNGRSTCTGIGTGWTRHLLTSMQLPDGTTVPLDAVRRLKKPLFLVVGFQHDLGDGEDLVGLRRVTLHFK